MNHGGRRNNAGRKKAITDNDRKALKALIDDVIDDSTIKGIFIKMARSNDWKQWQLILSYKYGKPVEYHEPTINVPVGPVFGLRELMADYYKKYGLKH